MKGKKKSKIDIGMLIGNLIIIVLFLLSLFFLLINCYSDIMRELGLRWERARFVRVTRVEVRDQFLRVTKFSSR